LALAKRNNAIERIEQIVSEQMLSSSEDVELGEGSRSNTIAEASCFLSKYNNRPDTVKVDNAEPVLKLLVSYVNSIIFDEWNRQDDELTSLRSALSEKEARINELEKELDRMTGTNPICVS
jgi:hypothetical protein